MTAASSAAELKTVPSRTAWQTIRHGISLTPDVTTGLAFTVVLAVLASAGRLVVPLSVQVFIDRGLGSGGGVNTSVVLWCCGLALAVLVATTVAAYAMNVRLTKVTETALATLRIKAFDQVHRLSMADQQAHRRGALVSRITADVDQISQFLQRGGLLLLTSLCQVGLASVVMFVYSWQLTLLVYACFLPLIFAVPAMQRRLNVAYQKVRERAGEMLSAIAESVTGALVVRAYGVADQTRERVDCSVDAYRQQQFRAHRRSVLIFSSAEITAGLATAGVVVLGVLLGLGGDLTLGQLTGFLFLITLFISPVQLATEILNEAQNAVAGWRRVLEILDISPGVVEPSDGVDLPTGALPIAVSGVSFHYLDGPLVLRDVSVTIASGARVAVVGETGSGKSTFVKLLTRLADPVTGTVAIGGADLAVVRSQSLRSRVTMVPQDPFLFNTTVEDNVALSKPGATPAEIMRAFTELGLADWGTSLPQGLATQVGERGDAMSAGERQLVAIARAYLADPSVLVLDEATSAVDPATDVRLQRALERLLKGRTTVTIAHRLFSAESADEVLVFERGRLVQQGSHHELIAAPGSVYARLHASWTAHAGRGN